MVVVEWVDSTGLDSGGWMDADDIAENLSIDAMRHESVGYLVEESEDAIALAGSRNLSHDAVEHRNTKLGNVGVIPRAAITSGPHELARKRGSPTRRAPA
jgi:hypothetical protein